MDSLETNLASEFFEAQAYLYKYVFSIVSSMALKCAVELNIPEIIHNHGKPITLPELISNLEVHPTKTGYVDRLVRLLVHHGFLAETKIYKEKEEKEAYTLTPPSKFLVKGRDPCLASMATGFVDSGLIKPLNFMARWFGGEEKSATESAFGVGFWDLLRQNPECMESFNNGMASDSQMINVALKDCKGVFNGLDSIVDVGGGTGTTSRIISEAFPSLKCIVFDLPQVVGNLSGSNNLSFVGGSMLESIPSADAVLLKWILHDWSDEDCITILKKCKQAISGKGNGGKLIIIDVVINGREDNHDTTEVKLGLDVLMMAIFNGKERNEKEWDKLLLEAGFMSYKITPIFGLRSLIEAYP